MIPRHPTTQPPMLSNYLNIRIAYGPTFSRDSQHVAFLTNITGVPQVWRVPRAGGWADQLTFQSERVTGVTFAPKTNQLLFARDAGSNENMQLFLINSDGSGERRLTNDDGAMHIFGDFAPDGQRILFTANRRDRAYYDVYVQGAADTEAQCVWTNDQLGYLVPLSFSPDGGRALVALQRSSLHHALYEITLANGAVRLLTSGGEARYGAACYSADGQAIFCACDLGRDLTALMRLDLNDLTLSVIAAPDHEVDFIAPSPDGRAVAWAQNVEGAHQLMLSDLVTGQTRPAPLPTGVILTAPTDFESNGLVFAPDSGAVAFAFSTATRTLDIWVWELATDQARPITHSSHAGVPQTALAEPELIRYPTFDGRAIPAWFFRAPNAAGEKRPVVVMVHGGPEGQTQPYLNPILQFFVSQGYHVLAPNVRGSSGYGKTYLNLDNVEKRMDSVADLAQAVTWLRAQPEVNGRKIAVYGGSYGGFMVLAAITTYPDLWAAAVDIVGISNFVTFLENTGAYRRSHREAEYGSLERDRVFLTSISPIHQVDRITAPLLVVHGANDPRVPLGEAEQMVNALRARQVPVEFLVYHDEGHGLVKLANKLDAYPKMAAFLKRHLTA
jgi:dipeptidyl aminopeptidase/acylaminoacyl peptidase